MKRIGLEYFQKYYAVYPGIVEDVEDPEKRGRIKISMPSIFGAGKPLAQWAVPQGADLAGQATGSFFPPYVGDVVDVTFENGNINVPRYMGGFWAVGELPPEFLSSYTKVKGWVFKSKQKILIDESPGKLKISIENGNTGAFFVLDDTAGNEGIYLQHPKGSLVQIDKDGSIVEATSAGNLIYMNNKKSEILMISPDGSFIKIGNGILISDPTGKNFININKDTLEINSKNMVQSAQNVGFNSATVGLGSNAVLSAVIGENLEAYLTLVHTALVALGQAQVPLPSLFNLNPITSFRSDYVKIKSNIPV